MAIKAVVFDLDGTLLDTLQDLADCYNRVLESRGYPTHPVQAYRFFVGDGGRKCMERALPAMKRDPRLIDACLAEQQADYRINWHCATREYAGMTEVLQTLSSRGLKLAVLSNKDHQFTQLCIDYYFPTIRFEAVQGFVPQIPYKPDPTSARRLMEQMSVPARQACLVGDTAIDMQTATGAGMLAIGALWGFRGAEELLDAGANHLIETPADLVNHPGLA